MELYCKRLKRCGCGNYICCFDDENRSNDSGGCRYQMKLPAICSLLEKDLRDERQKHLNMLKRAIQAEEAMLVIGSGASIPLNMPDWKKLISQLSGYALQYQSYTATKALDTEEQKRHSRLEGALISGKLQILDSVNMLEAGQYIRQALDAHGKCVGNDLLKGVISAVVENSKTPEDFLKENPHLKLDPGKTDARAEYELGKANTLCAIAYLMRGEKGFHRAMTYNYDTLVQEYLISAFGVPETRIVSHSEGWTAFTEENPIEFFYLHGCVPRKRNRGRRPAFPQESRKIILSEDSYYNTERFEAYNWQNSVQSYFLNQQHCAFVGFSADDYNFRRILRQLGEKSNHPEHYLFMTVDQLISDTYESVCRYYLKHRPADASPEEIEKDTILLLNQELLMKSHYWARYCFYPIWVTIDEIPETLCSLI